MNTYIERVKQNHKLLDQIELASRSIVEYMKDVYPDFDLMLDIHDMEDSTLGAIDDIIREALD